MAKQLIAREDGRGTETPRDFGYTDLERLRSGAEEFLVAVDAPAVEAAGSAP